MKKMLLLLILALPIGIFAQNYPHLSVKDIQYIDPDSLTTYFNFPLSQYVGDTVVVTGIVMEAPYMDPENPDSVIMYVGNAAGFFMQDTARAPYDWSGIFVFHPNDVPGEPFSTLDSGLIVNITGVVTEFSNGSTQKTTELTVIDFNDQNVVGQTTRPQPVHLTIDSLKNSDNTSKPISVKWEGVYVEFDSVMTLDRTSSGGFKIQDANGLTLNIYTRSDYFYGYPAPADGTILRFIRGYIETRSEGGGGVSLDPAYRSDFEILTYPPSITNIHRNPAIVGYGQSVDITADITDEDGTVDTARVIWRKNGGSYQVSNMAQITTTNWKATLPAQNDSSFIDYFIWAKDNDGHVSINPSDTSKNRYTFFILNHALTIQHIQYSPFGSAYSSYNGDTVTVSGVVTSDTSDINGNSGGTGTISGPQVYIQNGQGTWSGIKINGTETYNLHRGDYVSVTGRVEVSYIGTSISVTQIAGLDNPSSIDVISTGNTLPSPEPLTTSVADMASYGTVHAEQWEGVLVKYENITVTDENADGNPGPNVVGSNSNYGDILVSDASNSDTRINLENGNNSYHNFWNPGQDTIPVYVRQNSTFESVTGVLWYSFGNYKLVPRKDDDFVGYVSDVKVNHLNQPLTYNLNQNYPNPFNPSTKISYTIPKGGLVTLKIYNILGQEVQSLVNQYQNPGEYSVNFNASRLPSGIYLYRMTSDNFVQVKKMVLLK